MITDIYSKRQQRLRGEVPDVYRYDNLPQPLKVQIVQIWNEAIGRSNSLSIAGSLFAAIEKSLCREFGVFALTDKAFHARKTIEDFFLTERDIEKSLSVVELVFHGIDTELRADIWRLHGTSITPEEAIDELNHRFREHGVGYQYANGQIIRVDSELIHKEVVVPALSFLREPYLARANQEFMSAHEHYRHGRCKECLVDCLKSFESTMKAICDKRGWAYQQSDTAKKLIAVCKDNGLFPLFMDNQLNGLVICLESGVPTARNKTSGHGQGTTPTDVAPEFAAYVLHLMAANILFLASWEKRLK